MKNKKKKPTIDDLLNLLQNPDTIREDLKNNTVTWNRIGNKDKFEELGLEESELESFLAEWISQNPYSNI